MTRATPPTWIRRGAPGGLLLLGLLAAPPAGAQGEAVCPEGRISSIFIDNHSVFDVTDPELNARFDWAYRLVNALHVPTREEVIRREILVAEGECYDIERLRDSERLLRALDFIAGVDIFGVRQPDGSFHVIVDTQDEWSTRVEPRLGSNGSLALRGLRLREDNLLGSGRQLSAFYVDDAEEKVYGFALRTPQLLGTRWDAEVAAGRTPVGYLVSQAVTYPFVGQVGRWALRQALEHHDRYFEYWMPEADGLVALWHPERRQSLELGAVHRWGTRGYDRTLLGVALAGERVTYPGEMRRAEPSAAGPAELPPPGVDSLASVRVLFLTGQRRVNYVRRRALDTVNGTEDVRLGVEAEIAVGPSLPGLARERDLALDLGLYAGGEPVPGILAGAQLAVEARRSYDAPPERSEWSNVFAQLEGWAYWRPSPGSRHALVGAVSAVGGWHGGVPFQLTLGSDAGLRGYPRHVDPGGRRIVASLEHRSYLGWPLPELFDLGTVAFVDVGKIWAGDAPFGRTSPLRADVGLGLRAAFPPGSRQTLRLDLGVPLRAGVGVRDLVLSVGVGQLIGARAAQRDPQLQRSTRRGLSSSTFSFASQP